MNALALQALAVGVLVIAGIYSLARWAARFRRRKS